MLLLHIYCFYTSVSMILHFCVLRTHIKSYYLRCISENIWKINWFLSLEYCLSIAFIHTHMFSNRRLYLKIFFKTASYIFDLQISLKNDSKRCFYLHSLIMTDSMVMRSSICEELRLERSKELEGISHISFIT